MSEVDPKNTVDSDEWQNEFLLWCYENDTETYYKWIQEFLSDIDIIDGVPFLILTSRNELGVLFCDGGRDGLSRETVENILSEDSDWFEYYSDTTDDVYRDVIQELDKKNIERLKEYIIAELLDQELSVETEEMELIAEEQGHENYWTISQDNVARIIDDEESMNSLLDDELSDLKSELYSVHNNAYNNAYENTLWKDIWSEIEEYFEGQGEYVTRPHSYKENVTVYQFKIKIRDLNDIILEYLDEYKNSGSRGTLAYEGSFLSVLSNIKDCIRVYPSDSPDYREVDKNINEYFEDFI